MALAAQEVFHQIEYMEVAPAHDLLDVQGALDAQGLVAREENDGDLHHALQEGLTLDHQGDQSLVRGHQDDQNLTRGHQGDQAQGHQKGRVQGHPKGHAHDHQKGHAQGHQRSHVQDHQENREVEDRGLILVEGLMIDRNQNRLVAHVHVIIHVKNHHQSQGQGQIKKIRFRVLMFGTIY